MSYYKRELELIDGLKQFPAAFQFKDDDNKTKWLNLNQESAEALKAFIDDYLKRLNEEV